MRLLSTSSLFFLLFLFHTPAAKGQADTTAAAPPAWTHEVIGKLSASQAAYKNWTEGGLNTIAVTTALQGKTTRISVNWEQSHEARVAFGVVKQDTLAYRKSDDVIRFNSSLKYRGDGFFKTFNPTISLSGRTQFAEGFNYDKNPFKDGQKPPVKVSAFLSPATLTQTVGLTYVPAQWVRQRVGLAAKETIVQIERFRPLYGVDPDGPVRIEVGLEAKTEVDRDIAENVKWTSTLGLFAAFNQPDVPDMLWENTLAMKVNSWLSVNVEAVALFDRDFSRRIQLKEVLSIGVSYVFI